VNRRLAAIGQETATAEREWEEAAADLEAIEDPGDR
jgi:hypothetical protein